MANKEHLAILRQGVEVWNKWRSEGKDLKPDLSSAELYNTKLSGVDFCGASLIETNLTRANLIGADFREATLMGANLSYANLRRARLEKANLLGASLSGANLFGANLSYVDLRLANLIRAKLGKASLIGAKLHRANLIEAKLGKADIIGADLSRADLSEARFTRACLQNASLQAACLINAKLDGANLTDACLWETQRAGWSIKGIICESIYWDEEAKEKTIYAPGEFERLFTDKTRIRLLYKDGISAFEIVTLPSLIQRLEKSNPGSKLNFISIKDDSGGAIVELAIESEEGFSPEQFKQLQAAIEQEAQQRMEYQRLALAERETRLQLQFGIDQLNTIIDKLINRPTYLISGPVGAAGLHAHAHDNSFNQISDSQVQQNSPAAIQNVNIGTFNPGELNSLLKTLKDSLDQITLDDDKKSELQSDLTTLEAQVTSPKPKAAIIRETLYSIRNILEGAAGSGVAAGIIYEIARLLQ